MHCFPGGAIEPGETEQAAIIREMQEELALAARPARRLWESVTPWQVRLAWWLAEIGPSAEPVANPAEVAAIHWLTPAEIRKLPNLLASNLEFLAHWEAALSQSNHVAELHEATADPADGGLGRAVE
jgi:8-oxo-dGTP pyrophosphatase MutT (NUDIX family)